MLDAEVPLPSHITWACVLREVERMFLPSTARVVPLLDDIRTRISFSVNAEAEHGNMPRLLHEQE